MKMTSLGALVVSAVVCSVVTVSAANAVPLGRGLAANPGNGDRPVLSVDLRPYRHCHWTDGHRWCHGPHYDDDDYGFEEFEFPFLGPFFWGDDYFGYYGGRRHHDRRDYRRHDRGGREGRREGRRDHR